MDNIFKDIAAKYHTGSLLVKLIFINIAVFLIVRITGVILTLSGIDTNPLLSYLQLPSNLSVLIWRPWTLFTYMFLQYDLLHILFNMLWLYWFGQLFLHFFSEKQLGGLYILGGLSGAVLYLLAYNLIPWFSTFYSVLLGSSAAVLAIVIATAVYAPDFKINLLFFGAVSLKYIALITVLLDAISITSQNAGGHIAHLGGALLGFIFVYRWKKGKDITRFINTFIDKFVVLFKPRPKIKIKYKRPESDMDYRTRKQKETADIDTILDKIKRSGYSALTTEEKKKLFDASKN
ncbi:rhomboid family intramembrane serine protease [Coprobacter sp.]